MSRPVRVHFPIALMLAAGLAAGPTCRPLKSATVLKTLDFERGNLKGWSRKKLAGPHSAVIVRSPHRKGRYAVRFTLRKRDRIVSKSKRAELELKHHAKIGREYWYGFSIYIPRSWKYDRINEVVAQWNATRDKELDENARRSPPLALRIKKNYYYITIRWDARRITPAGNKAPKLRLWKGAFRRGRWTDWVVHTKWSYRRNGLLEIWRNGGRIVRRRGPNCYNDKRGLRFKIGIYKPKWASKRYRSLVRERVIYHDEVRVGNRRANYNDVAPQRL